MRLRKAPPFPFLDDEVVTAIDGFYSHIDGAEVLVAMGSRHRSSEDIVHARPELFQRDGEPLRPFQRPEVVEPTPAPKPPVKRYRAKKDWSPPPIGFADQKMKLTVKKDQIYVAGRPPISFLSPQVLKEMFELVKD